jgi:hypothetical protein
MQFTAPILPNNFQTTNINTNGQIKLIKFNWTINNNNVDLFPINPTIKLTNNNQQLYYENKYGSVSPSILSSICADARFAMAKYISENSNPNEAFINSIGYKFHMYMIRAIRMTNDSKPLVPTIRIEFEDIINDMLLSKNNTEAIEKLLTNGEELHRNIVVFSQQINTINSTISNKYWGKISIKRMEKKDDGYIFVPPPPISAWRSQNIKFQEFKGGAKNEINSCKNALDFTTIDDYKTLSSCIEKLKELNTGINKDSIQVKDIITVISKLGEGTAERKLYENINDNIKKFATPYIKTKNYIPTIDNKNINVKPNLYKSTLNSLNLTTIQKFITEIIDAYDEYKEPVQPSVPEENLVYLQITFTFCEFGTKTPSKNCFHKAYAKVINQIEKFDEHILTPIMKWKKDNIETIYESVNSLYTLKNNGYRLVKLVDDREHAYFIENPQGFVKQPSRKVTEYKLGENVAENSIHLEDIIELNPLIQKLTNENADLDIAFLAKNPDATDLEHMAILRNGISYQTP